MNGKSGLIALMFLFNAAFAQTCIHTGLSNKFDFKVTRVITDTENLKSAILIQIYKKTDHALVQQIRLSSNDVYSEDFIHSAHDRSFVTGKNKNAEITDGDYGDIVVADFNFDGREDFAIKKYHPADTGPTYYFYIQTDKGFKRDNFLTNRVNYFPSVLNVKRHLLVTAVAVAMGTTIRQFCYDPQKEKWRIESDTRVEGNSDVDLILKKLEK